MLFISRYCGGTEWQPDFGVVDTDDGVEEVVCYDELDRVCVDYDLDIAGVTYLRKHPIVELENIIPWQAPSSISALQAKLAALYGIHTTIWNGMITSITWGNSAASSPATIRLSNLGHSCADYLLNSCMFYQRHIATFVLDDSVTITGDTFKILSSLTIGMDGLGAAFDLREVSDDSVAKKVYLCVYEGEENEPYTDIIDSSERKRRMYEELVLKWRKSNSYAGGH